MTWQKSSANQSLKNIWRACEWLKRNQSSNEMEFLLTQQLVCRLLHFITFYLILYFSDSQPGCRGTQGCREEVSGVPPNDCFTVLFSVLPLRVLQIRIGLTFTIVKK